MKKLLCFINARIIFLRIMLIVGILFICVTFLSSCLWKQGSPVNVVYKPAIKTASEQDIKIAETILKRRLDELGYFSSLVKNDAKSSRIIVKKVLWKEDDFSKSPEEFFEKMGKSMKIIFQEVDDSYHPVGNVLISGDQIRDAKIYSRNNQYQIVMQLNSKGTRILAEVTEVKIGKHLGIFIDEKLIMAPQISGTIDDGYVQIDGFTKQKAKETALYMKTGNLPFHLEVVEISK